MSSVRAVLTTRTIEVLGCIWLALLASWSTAADDNRVDFELEIKPLLSDRCFVCHGPDQEHRQADLRLDTPDGLLAESQSGNVPHIVAPGKPEESELWLRISTDDPDLKMPPADSKLDLSEAERVLLRRWIEEGAVWASHWSLQPVPNAMTTASWLAAGNDTADNGPSHQESSPIDTLIHRQQLAMGVGFSPEATKETLIRRVTFDLTGLPPTLDEIDAFLADTTENAYERVVDRLLTSQAYGERMASEWLDVARYSDTYGYQVDRDRFVWPWRDWVVRAFNKNMPYDQFITEQLAGDLLPNATQDQILATTFNRLHPQKVEGGSVPEEFRIEYVADRTQTFATSMLGLTMECARCHDHKYDPILQREYYELSAFFANIDEAGLYSYFTPESIPTPTLLLTTVESQRELDMAEQEIRAAQRNLEQLRESRRNAFQLWRTTANRDARIVSGCIEQLDFETVAAPNSQVEGVSGKAAELTGDDAIGLTTGNFRRFQPFSVACWLNVPKRYDRAVVFHRSAAWTDAASRGYQLLIQNGQLSASLIHFWPGNAMRIKTIAEFPIGRWHHVTMTYDGSGRAAGLQLYVDGARQQVHVVRDNLFKNITGGGGDNLSIGQRFRDKGLSHGQVDTFQVFDRELGEIDVAQLYSELPLSHWLDAVPSEGTTSSADVIDDQPSLLDADAALFDYFLAHDDVYLQALAPLQEARKQYCELMDKTQEIMVMREMPTPRKSYVLKRGAYDARGDEVTAATPAALPAMPPELPRNRLGLAQWLTSSEHPLASRVVVNRMWQLVFGVGLVRTPEDFGSQGESPTHPKLLDWLARDFMDQGWDLKRMLKQLVMSRTYRQSSVASPELLQRDPENRLFARGSSFRWPAEMLRDQALAVSGLMVDKPGGAPSNPYDLEEAFKPATPDQGEGLYRRSLYTYWRQTGPAPMMIALDAVKREVCRMQRSRTSSPLQTLVLMNSPQFVEAARGLAEQVLELPSQSTEEKLAWLFRRMVGRQPDQRELAVLVPLWEEQHARFLREPEQMQAYLEVGYRKPIEALPDPLRELAAYAAVANTLFGFDECMMKQ